MAEVNRRTLVEMASINVLFVTLALICLAQQGLSLNCFQCAVTRNGDSCQFPSSADTNSIDCQDGTRCATFSFEVDTNPEYTPLVRTCVNIQSDCRTNPPAEHLAYCNICDSDLCNDDVFFA